MSRFCLGLALLLAACASPRIGEVGPTACKGGDDEDHDGLIDCEDPDCQNLDQCRQYLAKHDGGAGGTGGSDGGTVKPTPMKDSGALVVPDKDSGTGVSQSDEDSGVDMPVNDASTPPPTCMPKCLDTEECIDLVCKPVTASTSQTIAVTIQEARGANADLITACLDFDCLPAFAICCPIDPYVRVIHVRADGSSDPLGQTATVPDKSFQIDYANAPTWNVALAEGDYLVFELWDDNAEVDDRLIFDCKPDLANFKSGPQTCNSLVGTRPTSITADLQAKK